MQTLPSEAPFIHIHHDGAFRVTGTSSSDFGHALPSPGSSPDGVFARWHWDGTSLTVHNDRYGFYPLFYFARPGEICVSPSLVRLLQCGAPRELDREALAVFLRLGYFLGEDTPFRAIRAVPPNALFRWTGEAFEVTGRYPIIPAREMPREQAVQVFQELFSAALRRRPPVGRVALPLSGGRDSRHILLELCESGCKPDFVATVDRRKFTDRSVAAAIAAALGVPQRVVPDTPPSVANERRRILETHLCSDEHGWAMTLRDSLIGKADCLYDGIGGDVLSASSFLNAETLRLSRARRPEDLARWFIDYELNESLLSRLLLPERLQEFSSALAIQRLAPEIERHLDAPNPIGSYLFWNRTRREIALSPYAIFQAFTVYAPYLDHDLYDFLASLPVESLVDRTLHDQTIAAAYPWATRFPYASKVNAPLRFSNAFCALGVLRALIRRPSSWIQRRYVVPRLARATCDPFFNRRALKDLTNLPIYLQQLEELSGMRQEPV